MSVHLHIFRDCLSILFPYRNESLGELITRTALYFCGFPYQEYTLEKEPETLTLNLQQFDCQTFIENVLAIAYTLKKESLPSFERYCFHLQNIRYRNGIIRSYTDRLIYFSDWITENERQGYIRDITQELGGIPYSFTLTYCSAHPEIYKPLRYAETMSKMKQKEIEISNRNSYFRISEEVSVYGAVKNGDIIAFTTNRTGLEITHVALAYYDQKRLTFIHATSINSRTVLVSPISLYDYIHKNSFVTGMMIARPV